MTLRIRFPDKGDFAAGKVQWEILNATGRHRTRVYSCFDLTDCTHLKPYAIACIVAMALSRSEPPQLIMPGDSECAAHLKRMGVERYFAIESAGILPPRSTNIGVEHLNGGPAGDFASRAMHTWSEEFGGLSASMESTLADYLDEIILNALTHSDSPVGCIVAGQAFPTSHAIEVAILDLGQTIRGHLAKNPKYADASDDESAILLATKEGVTGTVGLNRWGEPNSGVGLADLRAFCEAGNGSLTVLSGLSYLVFSDKSKPVTRRFRGGFEGTLVNARFFTDRSLTDYDLECAIW